MQSLCQISRRKSCFHYGQTVCLKPWHFESPCLPEYPAHVSISLALPRALAYFNRLSTSLGPSYPSGHTAWSPSLIERAVDGLRRSEYPFGVVLGRHFTPELIWSGDTYAGTRYPEALSRLGLRISRFRRFCITTLLPCLHSSFTMTTCSTYHRVRLTTYRLSTLALRHLMTIRLP